MDELYVNTAEVISNGVYILIGRAAFFVHLEYLVNPRRKLEGVVYTEWVFCVDTVKKSATDDVSRDKKCFWEALPQIGLFEQPEMEH